MPIPMVVKASQDEIGKMVYSAYGKRADALASEDQAQSLLVEALGYRSKVRYGRYRLP